MAVEYKKPQKNKKVTYIYLEIPNLLGLQMEDTSAFHLPKRQ